jgi:serine/threonine protein kinase
MFIVSFPSFHFLRCRPDHGLLRARDTGKDILSFWIGNEAMLDGNEGHIKVYGDEDSDSDSLLDEGLDSFSEMVKASCRNEAEVVEALIDCPHVMRIQKRPTCTTIEREELSELVDQFLRPPVKLQTTFQRAKGDSIADLLHDKQDLRQYARTIHDQVEKTIKCMEKKGITHNDLTKENIFFDTESKEVTVIDFDAACMGPCPNDDEGARYYRPPLEAKKASDDDDDDEPPPSNDRFALGMDDDDDDEPPPSNDRFALGMLYLELCGVDPMDLISPCFRSTHVTKCIDNARWKAWGMYKLMLEQGQPG